MTKKLILGVGLCSGMILLQQSAQAQVVTTLASGLPSIYGIAVGKLDTIYVTSTSDYRIRKITPTGTVSVFVGTGSSGSTDGTLTTASISQVYDLEYSKFSDNLYFTEYPSGNVRKVSPGGVVSTVLAGGAGSGGTGTAVGVNDTLYTISFSTGVFRRIDPTGAATTISTVSTFGVDLDFVSIDTLYFGNHSSNQLLRLNRAGVATVVAGSAASGYVDATGTAARFNYVPGLAIDGAGDIFVTDLVNNRIRKVTPAGVVTTFAGSGTGSSTDGTGTSATFAGPYGMTISPTSGNLYVSDNGTGRVRMITGGVPLPLDWISYSASLSPQNNARLEWKVNEKNVGNFQVLKSVGGDNFQPIGTIGSKGDGENTYSFTEPQSLSGTAYYRIRQTDNDGTQSSSATLVLKGNALQEATKVYPTVFSDGFNIETAVAGMAKLNNGEGRIVQLIDLKEGVNYVSVAGLPTGAYYLQTDASVVLLIKQ